MFITCNHYIVIDQVSSFVSPIFPGNILRKTDKFRGFPGNFPGDHMIWVFSREISREIEKHVQRSNLIRDTIVDIPNRIVIRAGSS